MTIITEVAEVEAALSVLDSSLALVKWRLKPYAKRRLQIDVIALCTGMRPVVMVDYGGKMPELQGNLCGFLSHAQKESAIFQQLWIMVIEDMIYMVNVDEFAEYISWSLHSVPEQLFVDLEHDPLKVNLRNKAIIIMSNLKVLASSLVNFFFRLHIKMIRGTSEKSVAMQLVLCQKYFSFVFRGNGVNYYAVPNCSADNTKASSSTLETYKFSEVIDLSSYVQDTLVTIPSINGWLLCYPVVYLFGKDHIPDALHNLSTKSLRIFKVLACINVRGNDKSQLEEIMSFSVPSEFSTKGINEPWSIAFWSRVQVMWGRCQNVWKSLQMEVTECSPQAVVL